MCTRDVGVVDKKMQYRAEYTLYIVTEKCSDLVFHDQLLQGNLCKCSTFTLTLRCTLQWISSNWSCYFFVGRPHFWKWNYCINFCLGEIFECLSNPFWEHNFRSNYIIAVNLNPSEIVPPSSVMAFYSILEAIAILLRIPMPHIWSIYCHAKGRVAPPKQINLRKMSKRPLTPPSSSSENDIATLCQISCSKSPIQRSKICNTIFFWKWPFGNFFENSSALVASPLPNQFKEVHDIAEPVAYVALLMIASPVWSDIGELLTAALSAPDLDLPLWIAQCI